MPDLFSSHKKGRAIIGGGCWLIFVAAALLVLGASRPWAEMSVQPAEAFSAIWQRQSGWIGADGAYSVALGDDRVLWLFGDTLVGSVQNGRRVETSIIRNSVAIQHGLDPQEAGIRFYFRPDSTLPPQAIFKPPDGKGWLWPMDGIVTSSGLVVFLVQVRQTEETDSFGFKLTGLWAGHIADFSGPPDQWPVNYTRVPWAGFAPSGDRLFGSALLLVDDFVYIYGTDEDRNGVHRHKFMILARAPQNRLLDFDAWKFYAGGQWLSAPDSGERLCDGMANELSVSYDAAIDRYVAVYTRDGFLGPLEIRMANRPWGPWQSPIELYRCPEMAKNRDAFCYAGKGHPAVSPPGTLLVSYVAGSTNLDLLAGDATLYWPRFLRVELNPPRPIER